MNPRNIYSDFRKFAMERPGVSGLFVDDYTHQFTKQVGPMMTPMAYTSPYIVEKSDMNLQTIDIFSRLMRDRIIMMTGGIDDDMASIVTAQLLWLKQQDDADKGVSIYINSPGGSIVAGNAILDCMEYIESPSLKISTVALGIAASMASIILVAGSEGERYATKRSRILLHQPLGGFGGGHVQASDMEIEVKEIMFYKKQLFDFLSEKTGKSYEEIEKDADRDFWLSPEEALNYGPKGLIDHILAPEK
jgi:ATP-dependent Clp protease protease subunit